jgi:hypothetical protein
MAADANGTASPTGDAPEARTADTPSDETKPPADNQTSQQPAPPAKDSHLAQWVAIGVALLATATAIVSALISAHTSDSTSHMQSHSAAVLAQRQELRDAYAKLAADANDVEGYAFELVDFIRRYPDASSEQIAPPLEKYNEAQAEYQRQIATVEIVDSPDVQAAAIQLVHAINEVQILVYVFRDGVNHGNLTTVLGRLPEYDKKFKDADDRVLDFAKAARKELNNLGYG